MNASDVDEPSNLTSSERRVLAFAEQDPLGFATSSGAEIARVAGTSSATVTRTARKLGFTGIKELKLRYASTVQEGRDLITGIRSRLSGLEGASGPSSAQASAMSVLTASAELLLRLGESLRGEDLEEVVSLVVSAPRVVVHGLGTGALVAAYLSLGLQRIGVRSESWTGSGHDLADEVHRLCPDDLLIVVAPRALFPDVTNLLHEASSRVGRVVLISQAEPPPYVAGPLVHLALPTALAPTAEEVVGAWGLADVLIGLCAKSDPSTAIAAREDVQRLRERLSPRRIRPAREGDV